MVVLFLGDAGLGLRETLLPRASDFATYTQRLRGIVSSRLR